MGKPIKDLSLEEFYQEALNKFCEMSNYRKRKTGLPMNIWIDQAENYKDGGHTKRIKFQINKADKYQNNCCPMLLDGSIPNEVFRNVKANKEFNLSNADIIEVKNFVCNNAYALDKVADQLIFEDEFDEVFIFGGNPASENEKIALKNKVDNLMRNHND